MRISGLGLLLFMSLFRVSTMVREAMAMGMAMLIGIRGRRVVGILRRLLLLLRLLIRCVIAAVEISFLLVALCTACMEAIIVGSLMYR